MPPPTTSTNAAATISGMRLFAGAATSGFFMSGVSVV
jgi:hypothetical protein